jgi:hypothetical protein
MNCHWYFSAKYAPHQQNVCVKVTSHSIAKTFLVSSWIMQNFHMFPPSFVHCIVYAEMRTGEKIKIFVKIIKCTLLWHRYVSSKKLLNIHKTMKYTRAQCDWKLTKYIPDTRYIRRKTNYVKIRWKLHRHFRCWKSTPPSAMHSLFCHVRCHSVKSFCVTETDSDDLFGTGKSGNVCLNTFWQFM